MLPYNGGQKSGRVLNSSSVLIDLTARASNRPVLRPRAPQGPLQGSNYETRRATRERKRERRDESLREKREQTKQEIETSDMCARTNVLFETHLDLFPLYILSLPSRVASHLGILQASKKGLVAPTVARPAGYVTRAFG